MSDKKNNNGKRDMKKSMSSSSVLMKLYNNRKLVTKVDNLLDEGATYDYIVDFLQESGMDISKASLTNYKKKREEAIRTNTPLIQLLDKRAKSNVTYIKDKEVKNEGEKEDQLPEPEESKEGNIYNDLEFLDEVIKKGAKGLSSFDVVDTPLAMKAIDLKAKITNNQLSGLSIAGLREIQMRVRAKETAMMEAIMSYVPEDKHDELFTTMEQAEKEFYENLDLTEEDQRIKKAMEQSGLGI